MIDLEEAVEQKNPEKVERLAAKVARSRTNISMWDLNVVIFLFGVLVIVIILISLDIDTIVVAPVAISGLAMVWLMGYRRGKRLFQQFYSEELTGLQDDPEREFVSLDEPLTSREIEILDFAARGYSNKRIAVELGISINTVKFFMSRILTKLDASDRTGAVVLAIKYGIISIK